MSKLRQKMVREMELREFSVNTQKAYLAEVEGLVRFYRRSPDKIVQQEIEDYLLYLKNKIELSYRARNQITSGLKFFYNQAVRSLPFLMSSITSLCAIKKVMIDILFRSVSETLLQFGENPENGFGGKLGFMAFLHTWDQKILDHFIHCIIPAGALSKGISRQIHGLF